MSTDAIGEQNVSNDDKQNTVSVSTVAALVFCVVLLPLHLFLFFLPLFLQLLLRLCPPLMCKSKSPTPMVVKVWAGCDEIGCRPL